MLIVSFIFARGGSRGLKNKNLLKFKKTSLLGNAIYQSKKSLYIKRTFVSTDSKKIARVAKKNNAEIPFIRPKKLSGNTTPIGDVFVHAIKKLETLDYEFDIFVNLDCTVPFIDEKDIIGSINLLRRRKCDAVYGVYEQHLNPYFNMMELNSKGFLRHRSFGHYIFLQLTFLTKIGWKDRSIIIHGYNGYLTS